MNLPSGDSKDRRTLPRHIRDGEHDSWEDASATSEQPKLPRRRPNLWILLALLAVFIGAWVAIRSSR